jgi:glycerate kinase
MLTIETVDAAWRPCTAKWGLVDGGKTAVIGLTEASGIAQLPPHLRNPEKTSNLGTGLIITEALKRGCREILIGLGGSATTEGGISLATTIGYRFLDRYGKDIPLDGGGLARLAKIEAPRKRTKVRFVVATDVANPLCGMRGAARQFAAQKGAKPAAVKRLERGLQRLARIARHDLGLDFARKPGAGAAGGCGYGLMAFFRARPENGFQLVRRVLKLDELVRSHNLIITGEGCLDATSLLGKGPVQLGQLARAAGRPVWALCGRVALPIRDTPFQRVGALDMSKDPKGEPEAMSGAEHAEELAELASEMAESYARKSG